MAFFISYTGMMIYRNLTRMKSVIKILCGCVFFPGVEVDIEALQYYLLNRTTND